MATTKEKRDVWPIRSVDGETKSFIRIFAAERNIPIGQALSEMAKIVKIAIKK